MTALLVATLIVLPGPPAANTADDVLVRYAAGSETVSDFGPRDANHLQPQATSFPEAVERWRGLAQAYFAPADVNWALAIIECESGGDPDAKNPNSTATGLFQHLASYWPERAEAAGRGSGADIYDASAQFAVAAWLLYEGGGKSHWVCKA